jgi:hypothetical protein
LRRKLCDAGQLHPEQHVLVIEGGDLDPGELFAVPAAADDVVKNGFAVRADEVASQALPDDVLGEPTGDPVRVAAPQRVDPAEQDQLEILIGVRHGLLPGDWVRSPRISRVASGQRLCSRFASSGASSRTIAAS